MLFSGLYLLTNQKIKIMKTNVLFILLIVSHISTAQSLEFYKKGNKAFDDGNLDEAVDYYSNYINSILELNTEWVPSTLWEAQLNRGMAYQQLGNLEFSMKDYTEVIFHEPYNDHAFALRAELKSSLGDLYGALKDYDSAINLKPKDGQYYSNRGVVKGKLENYGEAILDFNSAIDINSKDGQAYYNRGYALILSGKNIEGCNDLSKSGELGYFKAYDLIKQYCKNL